MIKIALILGMGFFISNTICAQPDTLPSSKNRAYLELGGLGGYYSINYEWRLSYKIESRLFGRVGISYWFNDFQAEHYLPIIAELNYRVFSKKKLEIMIGLGATIWANPPKLYDPNYGYYFFDIKTGAYYKWNKLFAGINVYGLTNFKGITPWVGVIVGRVIK